MTPAQTQALRQLLRGQTVASLGTLHEGEPFVSMVPFTLLNDGSRFVIHVSALSAHTRDMLASPHVSLLVVAPESEGTPPQARPRATIQGRAAQINDSSPAYDAAREAYLARFPEVADILEIPDFSFFEIRPSSVRFVAGFAQATTLTPEAFAAAVAGT